MGVTSQFAVPTVHQPKGHSGLSAVSAWIGIDGVGFSQHALQAGILATVRGDRTTYQGAFLTMFFLVRIYSHYLRLVPMVPQRAGVHSGLRGSFPPQRRSQVHHQDDEPD